jgi:hypothetical protein
LAINKDALPRGDGVEQGRFAGGYQRQLANRTIIKELEAPTEYWNGRRARKGEKVDESMTPDDRKSAIITYFKGKRDYRRGQVRRDKINNSNQVRSAASLGHVVACIETLESDDPRLLRLISLPLFANWVFEIRTDTYVGQQVALLAEGRALNCGFRDDIVEPLSWLEKWLTQLEDEVHDRNEAQLDGNNQWWLAQGRREGFSNKTTPPRHCTTVAGLSTRFRRHPRGGLGRHGKIYLTESKKQTTERSAAGILKLVPGRFSSTQKRRR